MEFMIATFSFIKH